MELVIYELTFPNLTFTFLIGNPYFPSYTSEPGACLVQLSELGTLSPFIIGDSWDSFLSLSILYRI